MSKKYDYEAELSKDNDFYCGAKRCHKTAWDTPEYLTESDFQSIDWLIDVLQSGDLEGFKDLINKRPGNQVTRRAIFDRILGWPEGYNYCWNDVYCAETAFPGLIRHTLPKLLAVVQTAEYQQLKQTQGLKNG